MDLKIKQYYKLNGLVLPPANIFSCVSEKTISAVFSEPKFFVLQANGTYRIKEDVIGGGAAAKQKSILVI